MRKNKLVFGSTLETHVNNGKAASIISRVFPGWSFECNYEFSDLGKVWVIWHPSVSVTVLHKSLQSISCRVQMPFSPTVFVATFVYGSNFRKIRRELWSDLRFLSTSPYVLNTPWTVLGDFNQTLAASEHSSSDAFSSTRGMRDFINCTHDTNLADLKYYGNSFTWSNNQGAFVISKKLDRILPKTKQPFKFFSMLNDHPDFEVVVKECWNSLPFDGTKMLKVSRKLKALKSIIRSFGRENYSGIEKRVSEAFDDLTRCQRIVFSSPSPQAGINERSAYDKWITLAKAEESFFYQRFRVNWLDKGDSNTGFYHRQMRQDLLGGEPVSSTSSLVDIEQLLSYRCSPSVSDSLSAAYTSQDVKTAFFALPKNKAPGPDGYPSEFFTAHWNTVGQEVTDAIQEFFTTCRLLQQWNATILTLIPKKKNADKISDFRPISCCNTVYKVIAKLLANRLKQVLPSVISITQSAFIPGRLLVENVLMATELVQGYNWKNITKRSILKVDLKKAFDSINWSFIFLILRALCFPDSYINLISQCITTTRFSVAVNGELGGYFKGARGLRQGDPLSPYLFVLAMEVLGQMLNKNYSTGSIGSASV
ncbi:PREDICTED: uncharacterized protein LOC106330256 [Brassica oleracea var. oleracea]|uniref:uncharacterized protein LOC106330256 n=1 Tax=Brassica oleracea var. oleracea TaxID=109376 RepID=UPI0006A739D2|nr:PREDICTED: uncharacterized protein LOC106330256 [Brassica oleracea var. oleracea]